MLIVVILLLSRSLEFIPLVLLHCMFFEQDLFRACLPSFNQCFTLHLWGLFTHKKNYSVYRQISVSKTNIAEAKGLLEVLRKPQSCQCYVQLCVRRHGGGEYNHRALGALLIFGFLYICHHFSFVRQQGLTI